jgi:mitochondrial fission protein ELM1
MNSRLRNFILRVRRWLTLRRMILGRHENDYIRIVASGISAEPLVASYRTLYGSRLYAVYLGSPRWPEQIFDFAVASHHAVPLGNTPSATCYRAAGAVAWIPGVFALPPLRISVGQEQVRTTALIGGTNKAFRLPAETIVAQLGRLNSFAEPAERNLTVVFSRRTPRRLEEEIRSALASEGVNFVDRHDRRGFLEAFASAKQLAITPDSITMVCEGYASEKSVLILDLPPFDQDTSTFRFVFEIRNFPPECVGSILREAAHSAVKKAGADYERWCRRLAFAGADTARAAPQ